jgi:hypothetical protein
VATVELALSPLFHCCSWQIVVLPVACSLLPQVIGATLLESTLHDEEALTLFPISDYQRARYDFSEQNRVILGVFQLVAMMR